MNFLLKLIRTVLRVFSQVTKQQLLVDFNVDISILSIRSSHSANLKWAQLVAHCVAVFYDHYITMTSDELHGAAYHW